METYVILRTNGPGNPYHEAIDRNRALPRLRQRCIQAPVLTEPGLQRGVTGIADETGVEYGFNGHGDPCAASLDTSR